MEIAMHQIGVASRDFRHAVMLAGKAVDRRSTIPILSMVRCAANGAFEAVGTDLDVVVTAKVTRTGSADASFMLADPRSVTGALASAGGETLGISVSDGKVALHSDALTVELDRMLPVDDFPAVNDLATELFSTTLSHAQLCQLRRIASAISTEETRYHLNGVYLHHLDGLTYRAVATDGHRMSMVDLVLPDAAGTLGGVIIPRKTIRLLLEIAGRKAAGDDQGIGVRIGNGVLRNDTTDLAPEKAGATRAEFHLGAGSAHVGIRSKLIDGTFPDYRRVLPTTDPACSLLFKADELRRAVVAASFGSDRVRAIRLHFQPGQAVVSAFYLDTGIATKTTVACQHNWPHKADLGVNGGYLLSMLDASGGDEFLIRTTDTASPMLIRNPADPDWTGLLMPMRV